MPLPATHAARTVVDGVVYVIGGLVRGGGSTNSVLAFDPRANRWTRVAPLPVATDHAAAASIDRDIYLFGGGFERPTAAVYRFNLDTVAWTRLADMPEPRAAGAAVELDGRVYVVGGFTTDRQVLSTAWGYEPTTGRWQSIAPIPTPRQHAAAAAFRREVCVAGGYVNAPSAFATFECYSPAANSWRALQPMLSPASDFDAVAVADAFVTVGDEIQVFRNGTWRLGPSLPVKRFGLVAAAVDGTVYAVGGAPRVPAADGLVNAWAPPIAP
jgi:N-acetylneuraminic acid mutarotase